MRRFLAAAALSCALLPGCATVGTLQTARPIEQGTTQVAVEPGLFGVEGHGWLPAANVAIRYGFGRRWDLGARLGTSGVGLMGKLALTDPSDEDFAVSVAPSVGGFTAGALGVATRSLHAQVPLIVGVRVGRGHELVLAPKVQVWELTGGALGGRVARASSTVVGAGGSVGFSLRVAPGVRILPEVAMVQPVFGTANARLLFWNVDLAAGAPIYQATVGILVGGERYGRSLAPSRSGYGMGTW